MTKRRTKGTGSIYEQHGHWMGAISLPSKNGKRERLYLKAATREEVVDRMGYVLRNSVVGSVVGTDTLTVADYLNHWTRSDLPGTVSLRTEEIYANLVRLYISPIIGQIRLQKLQPADVTLMLVELSRRGISSSTRRMVRATLHRALRVAQYNGLLNRNVVALSIQPRSSFHEQRSMTRTQAIRFTTAAQNSKLELALVLALSLGLRRGEILGLTWSDVKIVDGVAMLKIHQQLVRDSSGLHLSELKTRRSNRQLLLSPRIIGLLLHHRDEQLVEAARYPQVVAPSGFVFTTSAGTPIDVSTLTKEVATVSMDAGLGRWSPHELRHTCTSLLLAAGVSIDEVSHHLGHSSTAITSLFYSHSLIESKVRTARAMEQILDPHSDGGVPIPMS
ncbi:MAG: site-specific integrase [Actinomycetota bacterium]|nr:site-specific integrase [Actinomycetota bacterium]